MKMKFLWIEYVFWSIIILLFPNRSHQIYSSKFILWRLVSLRTKWHIWYCLIMTWPVQRSPAYQWKRSKTPAQVLIMMWKSSMPAMHMRWFRALNWCCPPAPRKVLIMKQWHWNGALRAVLVHPICSRAWHSIGSHLLMSPLGRVHVSSISC